MTIEKPERLETIVLYYLSSPLFRLFKIWEPGAFNYWVQPGLLSTNDAPPHHGPVMCGEQRRKDAVDEPLNLLDGDARQRAVPRRAVRRD